VPSWWRHHGAADSTNAIVDGGSVLFDVVVTSQVERLAHALNVALRKEWANVRLEAGLFCHARLTGIGPIRPQENGVRNWTMVLPILSYRLKYLSD
jgi:hypothetical protein